MQIGNQPWGDYWGSFKDKFGILWMIDYVYPKNGPNQELLIVRIFDAPREIVWKSWTEPQRVKKWWGPKNFTAPFASIDLRPGGKYLYCMRSPRVRITGVQVPSGKSSHMNALVLQTPLLMRKVTLFLAHITG